MGRADYQESPLAQRAQEVMVRGNTRSTLFVPPVPPYAVSAAGVWVTDQHGHQLIDANNNYTALIHGHAVEEINDAVRQLLGRGTALGLPTEAEVEMAELMAARTGYSRWRFSNSGTEAVMTAIRAARAFTGRDVILRFEGSYHGTSDAVVPASAPGITGGVRAEVVELPQGDRAAFDRAVEQHRNRIAAVLIDLMPNRAGLVPAQGEFVHHIRHTTREIDALMIVDEIISLRLAEGGLARTYNVEPDLITAGKIIGGGFPVGAVGGNADVLSVFDPLGSGKVSWGGTFSANPVSMVAGRVALEKFDIRAISVLNRRGDQLRTLLAEAGVAVTGSGSLLRIRELVDPIELWWAAYERDLLIGTNGLIALSTAMAEEDLSAIAEACLGAVEACRPLPRPDLISPLSSLRGETQ